MRSLLAAVLIAVGLVASQAPATAATMTYSVSGNCNGSCANVGMARGDLVFGTLVVTRSTFVVGGTIGSADLVDFSLTFGPGRTISRATSVGASLVGVWGNDLTTIAALDLRAATALAPATGTGLVLMLGSAILSTTANCATDACDSVGWTSAATLSGVALRASPGPIIVAAVPLPGGLGLGAGGLLALLALARRRGQG